MRSEHLIAVIVSTVALGACMEELRRDSPDSPPTLVFLEPTDPALTEGESVRLSAVLTDADGTVDLAGAQLTSPDGTVYGEFVASGEDGVYVLDLTWDRMHETAAIEFADREARELVATFTDVAGHEVSQPVTISLRCEGGAACAGVCVDTTSDPAHCGGCRQPCDEGLDCEDSACVARVRSIRGEVDHAGIDEVVAIRESLLDGRAEVVASVKGGRFALVDLDVGARYLIDFRSDGVSQGWLAFGAGAETARVIPAGLRDIALGRCVRDEPALEFVCDDNPLRFTDDDGDGTVDTDDDYLPRAVDESFEGSYRGTQLWNGLEYGMTLVRERSGLEWTIYIYGAGAPTCDHALSGPTERFRGGLAGLFSLQGWVSDTCEIVDQTHYLLFGDPDGTLEGEAIHHMVPLTNDCPAMGCLGVPPHGGGFEALRLGPARCG